MAIKYAQLDPFALSGAGAVAGATSIVLKSFQTIDGVSLAMTDFGAIGFGTLEPGNGSLEEQISFSGVVQNSNGTATLTGVNSVLFLSPYTGTSGLVKTHAGSTTFVISNTAGFYDQFTAKQNDETVSGQWTFLNTPIVPGVVSDASTTVKGVSKLSVAAITPTNPIVIGDNDPRVFPNAYGVDAGSTDTYVVNLITAPAAYVTGQVYGFKANTVNTGAATLNINGLGAKTIVKNINSTLADGDIAAGQICFVVYDGTNFRLLDIADAVNLQTFTTSGTWNNPSGAKSVDVILIGGGGGGGGAQNGNTGSGKGGGGGGGGGLSRTTFPASVLSSSVSVTVGTGGTGGTGGTTTAANGGNGNDTLFGTNLKAFGGGGGGGATASAGTAGTAGTGTISGGAGAVAGVNIGATSLLAAAGGGGGGNSSGANGGAGGAVTLIATRTGGTGGGGAASGSVGGPGTSAAVGEPTGGAGGGGGGAASAGTGANGGAGGSYGGGGGGGGSTTTSAVGASGGNGADGIVVVISYM